MSARWMTSAEAAAYLNYKSVKSFNAAVHRNGIPHRWAGGRMVFEAERLDAWVMTFRPRSRRPDQKDKVA